MSKSVTNGFRAFFVFNFLFLGALYADPTGPELVEARLPHFYKALVARVGAPVAAEYLRDWTAVDVEFFLAKARGLVNATAAVQRQVPSADQLFAKHSSDVFGMMGEVFGNVRSRARAVAPAVFIDEVAYVELNPDGKKPDGLAYEVRGKRLVIHFIMESKAGLNGYDASQMGGVLDRWRTLGITLRIDGAEQKFSAADIDLLVKSKTGHEVKPLVSTANVDCEPSVFLVATRAHPSFKGSVELLPIDSSTLREVIYSYAENLREERPVFGSRENFRVPELPSPQEVEAYRQQLGDWVGEHGTFPKAGGTSHLEQYLARQVSNRGGQAKTFVNDLDDASRHFLASLALKERLAGNRNGRSLPAMSPLERILIASQPDDPGVVSSLRAYFRGYVRTKETTTIESHPLITALKRNPAWVTYFSKVSPDELLHATVNDLNSCLDWLSVIGKGVSTVQGP